MEIHLNMYQTLAVAVLVLLFGSFLRHRIGFLEKFCIPAPVIGGLLFAILTCLMLPELRNFLLTTHSGKYAWYFSLPRSVFRPT